MLGSILRCGGFGTALSYSYKCCREVRCHVLELQDAQALPQALRWATRFLSMSGTWETPALQQVIRGMCSQTVIPRPKVALHAKTVLHMVKAALQKDMLEVAAAMVLSRSFMLRVPSETIPLQWQGEHSRIALLRDHASINLSRRKNSRAPVTLSRKCTCSSSPPLLCAVHWLQRLTAASLECTGTVFTLTKITFAATI